MKKHTIIFKSVLALSTVLALAAANEEKIFAEEYDHALHNEEKSTMEKIEGEDYLDAAIEESSEAETTPEEEFTEEEEEETRLLPPEIESLFADSFLLKGYSDEGVRVEVSLDNQPLIIKEIEKEGSFDIQLPSLEVGTVLSVVVVDEEGNKSDVIEAEVLPSAETEELIEDSPENETEVEEEPEEENEVEKEETPVEEQEKEPAEEIEEKEVNQEEAAEEKETNQPSTIRQQSMFSTQAAERDGTKYHYVQSGETLSVLARRYGITLQQLIQWNNLSNPNLLRAGDILSINGKNIYNKISQEQRRFTSTKDFIDYMAPLAETIAEENNLYASLMIAQAAHESAWGKSALATSGNNLFGVKGSHNGNSIVMLTWEEMKNGEIIWVQEEFALYPSYYESILSNADKLRNGVSWDPLFYRGAWVENTASHMDATEWLTGRYATDSRYHIKVNRTIANYNLTQYDKHIPITHPITSQRYINEKMFVSRGNFTIYTQPYGTASGKSVGNTSDYIGQDVIVTQEKVNNAATWWLIHVDGKQVGWVNKDALANPQSKGDRVLSIKNTHYKAEIVRPWSINTEPYGVHGYEKITDGSAFYGQVVDVVQEKITDSGTYVLISINGSEAGWINQTGINLHPVLSTREINYQASVRKPWSINTQPWGTEGFETIGSGRSYLNQQVEVIQEKTTPRSTYALLKKGNQTLGWYDAAGLEKLTILSEKDTQYEAQVVKPWSINTAPWGTEGYQAIPDQQSYVGRNVSVTQEKNTQKGTYALISVDGRQLGWIDKTALEMHSVLSVEETQYRAMVTRPWSINSRPWGIEGYNTIDSAKHYLNEKVDVIKEKVTPRSTYALIGLNGKTLGWIDTTGLDPLSVLSSKDVYYAAKITKPWSINSQPWGTKGYETTASGSSYLGESVTVVQEKVTQRGTYALIERKGELLGWIDTTGIEAHNVLSTIDTHYTVEVTKPWSINTKPWGTEGAQPVKTSGSLVGERFNVIQEKRTNRSTYVLLEKNNQTIGWIDSTGVQKKEGVLSVTDTNYSAVITQPWSINTRPWGTKGYQPVVKNGTHLNKTIRVLQEKVTERSTYALIQLNGEKIGWIDRDALKKI